MKHYYNITLFAIMFLFLAIAEQVGAAEMKEAIPMQTMLAGSQNHMASGKVELSSDMGKTVLKLNNIKIEKVPDGFVYLTKNGDWRNGIELGMLKQFTGTISFDLPMGTMIDDYDTVVIWCKKFNVEIGRAPLPGALMK